MKKKMMLFTVIALLVGGVGCEKEICNNDCYIGEVIQLRGKCNSIIAITSSPEGGLSIGETIAFNPEMVNQDLIIGDIVRFKIIQYEKWNGTATADCIWATFTATIETL